VVSKNLKGFDGSTLVKGQPRNIGGGQKLSPQTDKNFFADFQNIPESKTRGDHDLPFCRQSREPG
jgi:hypothetical protein